MKKRNKIKIAVIGIPIFLVLIFSSIYLIMSLPGVIEPYQVGNPDAKCKILIASQGTEFKDKLLKDLVLQLKNDEIFLSIVDCTSLDEENMNDWNAVVIIHTIHMHEMLKSVRTYLERTPDLSKVVLVTTSGGADEEITDFEVDALSTASRLSLTDTISKWTVSKVENILASDNE